VDRSGNCPGSFLGGLERLSRWCRAPLAFWNALGRQCAQQTARNPRSLAFALGALRNKLIGTTKVVPFHKSRLE